jgi:type I restriction enzyme, S subunit
MTTIEEKTLPADWKVTKLANVVAQAQAGFASGERDPNGFIQLRMNNVTTNGQFDWTNYLRVPTDQSIASAYTLEKGDVLFNNTNSKELVGKTALFQGHEEPILYSNHFTRLRTDESKLLPEFLAMWLQTQWQQKVFANICNRWIGQSAVQRDKLLALEIVLPPLPEQKRIAAILTEQLAAVDRARAAAEAQLNAINKLSATVLQRAFSGEI